jgi:hypothetical protein
MIRDTIDKGRKYTDDHRGYRWIDVNANDIVTAIKDAKTKEANLKTERELFKATPEGKAAEAKRDAERKRFSAIQQQWADEEEMERAR